MTETVVSGRHRAPGRYNPLTEISTVVTRSAEPAVKTSAVLAASGGLVAAFALPAQAAPADVEATATDAAKTTEITLTSLEPAVTAPAAASPVAAPSFGVLGFEAVAKPEPRPEPARVLDAVADRAATTAQVSRTEVRQAPAPTGGVLEIAASLEGIYYVYGGTTPAGFDCSGFTQYVFAQVGISLPRTAEEQRQYVAPVSDPQPGDLVFFGIPAYHMGIYAGNGMMWDSPRTGKAVSLRPIWSDSVTYGRAG